MLSWYAIGEAVIQAEHLTASLTQVQADLAGYPNGSRWLRGGAFEDGLGVADQGSFGFCQGYVGGGACGRLVHVADGDSVVPALKLVESASSSSSSACVNFSISNSCSISGYPSALLVAKGWDPRLSLGSGSSRPADGAPSATTGEVIGMLAAGSAAAAELHGVLGDLPHRSIPACER